MNKVIDFFKSNKYAVIWTICYIVVMWAILKWMFNFNIFDMHQLAMLKHIHLYGFPGFVFGILILAAIPMYIATTMIILRTKKPLFTIPVPKFMEPVPEEKPADTTETEKDLSETEQKSEGTNTADQPEAKVIPTELRAAFIRARGHIGPAPKSNFDISNMSLQSTKTTSENSQPELQQNDELPIPSDFDLPMNSESFSDVPTFTPVFSDVNFDEEEVSKNDKQQTEETNKAQTTNDISEELNPVIEHLNKNGKEFIVEDGLILTKQDVIAAHNDPDFWIADEKTWFASGKQKPSPVDAIMNKAAETGLQPILYLGATNILDLETNLTDWKNHGIEIITDLSDLKK